ncbi:MAG TPA: hypothetical protein VFY14_14490 [Streptomyces sp.]|nr:hypothetical protein [Streptomyces sp.]
MQELHRLRERVTRLERGQRVAHGASLEDSALEVRDGGGSLRAVVGQQPDGTTGVNVVNGPVPPVPSAPTVEPALAALAVTWDGSFAGAPAAPLDWMRCEVHIGPDAGFTPDQGTLRDTIESPQGGTVTIPLPYTEWHVKLRSRTTSGVASPPTAAVAGTPRKAATQDLTAGAVTAETLAADAITGKTITGGEVTGAVVTGSIVQTSPSGQRVVVRPSNSVGIPAVQFYSGGTAETSPGEVVASVTDDTHPRPYVSLWAPTVDQDIDTSAYLELLSGGGPDNDQGEWSLSTGPGSGGVTQIYAYASDGGLNRGQIALSIWEPVERKEAALWLLPAGLTLTDVAGRGLHCINGVLSADNIATGTVVITPSAPHVPTQFLVSGLNVAGTTFRGYATANTTVPGVRAPVGQAGVTGVGVSSVTRNSLVVWVNRENITNTTINWMVIGS